MYKNLHNYPYSNETKISVLEKDKIVMLKYFKYKEALMPLEGSKEPKLLKVKKVPRLSPKSVHHQKHLKASSLRL